MAEPGLRDDHAHLLERGALQPDHLVGLAHSAQHAGSVHHHLRVVLGLDLHAAAVFQVHDDQLVPRVNHAVGRAGGA